jgi:Tol biopolymer transport system component
VRRSARARIIAAVLVLLASGCGNSSRRLEPVHNGWIVASRLADGLVLYRIEPDGSGVMRLSRPDSRDSLPVWKPDGSSFAFVRESPQGTQIRLMAPDGRDLGRLLTVNYSFVNPTWSPDGKRLAYDRGDPGTILVLDVKSKKSHGVPATGEDATWAPDGDHLAFEHDRTGDGDTSIWEVNLETRAKRQLTHPPGDSADHRPAWSPDGRTIAFERDYDIWLLDTHSGRERQLARFATAPSWSPDSRFVLVSQLRRRKPGSGLYAFSRDGSSHLVVRGFGWTESSWQPLRGAG